MYSFDFHVHTHYSPDSPSDPIKILEVARRKGLGGIAFTDHNTIRGGIDAAKHAGPGFHVIVGSEIRTEGGEIIGLFLNEEIKSANPFEVIDRIKSQGGLAVLPHPFRFNIIFHKTTKVSLIDIAEKVDAIEVFNARTSYEANGKAYILATQLGKPTVAGSDAHFYQEIGNAKTLLPPSYDEEELKRNILEGRARIEGGSNVFVYSIPFKLFGFLYSKTKL